MQAKTISCTRGAKAIRQAFTALMLEKEFEDITVGDIIRRSTYSRSCFYQHYYDKLDVAQQTLREEALVYVQMLIEQMHRYAGVLNEAEYVRALSLNTFLYIQKKSAFYRLLFRGRFAGMDLDFFCQLAVESFNQLCPFQVNPGYTPEELEFFTYCYTHMVMRYIRFWESKNFEPTPEQMASLVATLRRMEKPGQVFTPTAEEAGTT